MVLGCGQSKNKSANSIINSTNPTTATTSSSISTTSEPTVDLVVSENEIYEFMKIVIAEQKLSYDNGFDISAPDYWTKESLMTYLTDTIKKKQTTKADNFTFSTFTSFTANKCLTMQDINFMLKQKNALTNFKWDSKQFNFNKDNNKNWYTFSVPLFSKDKNKVVIQIGNLCSGLCGTGWTVLFTKENGKWNSWTGEKWIH